MCFSATASFALAGALAPVAGYALWTAGGLGRRWLALAAFPAAFAMQQAVEGWLWLGLDAGNEAQVALAARGFLIFSHFFWPAFVPFAVMCAEPYGWRRRAARWLAVAGAAFGLSICVPSILLSDWLATEVIGGSLEYQTTLIYDGVVPRPVLRGIYAAIVLSALFVSSHRDVVVFGVYVAVSLLATLWVFPETFISVWCFLAAVLSIYLAVMFWARTRSVRTA